MGARVRKPAMRSNLRFFRKRVFLSYPVSSHLHSGNRKSPVNGRRGKHLNTMSYPAGIYASVTDAAVEAAQAVPVRNCFLIAVYNTVVPLQTRIRGK